MPFEADAMEIIEDQTQTIAALHKQVSILKSQLKAAERAVEAQPKPEPVTIEPDLPKGDPSKKPAKAVA
jgi:hypothetical protein